MSKKPMTTKAEAASSSRRSAEERKPGRIIGVAESFQTQPSSHQIRLPQDSEYKALSQAKKQANGIDPASNQGL
ncbi:hypothetical protein [Paracoccus actinidiae]|uniref:hypothetical protein n=1 Tax=Paracoccus actinidiae TaxID=3064531 RepID=UPI0027D28E53|nr:hypothetical protein [Paracoccus sp. M09]